jgi:hypothetical protein
MLPDVNSCFQHCYKLLGISMIDETKVVRCMISIQTCALLLLLLRLLRVLLLLLLLLLLLQGFDQNYAAGHFTQVGPAAVRCLQTGEREQRATKHSTNHAQLKRTVKMPHVLHSSFSAAAGLSSSTNVRGT